MEILVEALFELFGEVVLGFVVELIGSAFSSLVSTLRSAPAARIGPRAQAPHAGDDTPPRPAAPLPAFTKFMLYLLLSTVLGLLSLFVFPKSFAHTLDTRVAVLVGTPIACGLLMAALGEWRRKRGRASRPLESFSQGFAFALPMALMRFFWTH
jgi:hypothetical protein